MRVVSGRFKGKKLTPPPTRARPTADRVKETLFNILAVKLPAGAETVLDLFAGSGSLGIEALSRGAGHCVFIDVDRDAVNAVRQNLKNVGAQAEAYELYGVDYAFGLKKLRGRQFGLILLDPPYAFSLCGRAVARIGEYGLLKPGGVIAVEHDAGEAFDPGVFMADTRDLKGKKLTFLTYGGEAAHNE
ncbi:MAG: 16S rRNA (guanine(966)-N(2))-methyltransferase RsmD [Clostridiales bacterium]|jgi:16S rRNA (guanine(966)-N(2))-methyltransferase RsmD|nr:16S rRNA (guanine(966)-N(2))-methyltransferase RsmD [Clostridiales bacterium]